MTATTALTAQNTQGVYDIHETPSDFVQKQIDVCIDDIGVDVVKTGTTDFMMPHIHTPHMLSRVRYACIVKHSTRGGICTGKTQCFCLCGRPCNSSSETGALPIADDGKVMVATSGAQLLPESAINELCSSLIPLTYLLTPNIPEAHLILQHAGQEPVEVNDLTGLVKLAAAVHKLGPRYVLLKGGHLPLTSDLTVAKPGSEKKVIANIVYGDNISKVIQLPFQDSRSTHGTGCSLACLSP